MTLSLFKDVRLLMAKKRTNFRPDFCGKDRLSAGHGMGLEEVNQVPAQNSPGVKPDPRAGCLKSLQYPPGFQEGNTAIQHTTQSDSTTKSGRHTCNHSTGG